MKAPFPDYARRPEGARPEPLRKRNRSARAKSTIARIMRVNADGTQHFTILPLFARPVQEVYSTAPRPANAALSREMDLWKRPVYNPTEAAWPTPRVGSTAPFDIPSLGCKG